MRKELPPLDPADEPLVDRTSVIPLVSRRTIRQQQKKASRQTSREASRERATLPDLPSELVLEILSYLRPSDVFKLSRTSKTIRRFTTESQWNIATSIIHRRYFALAKCFQLPVRLDDIENEGGVIEALQSEERQEILSIHKKPYQHIKVPDPKAICTCLTCILAWNQLCVVVDFARWQDNLEADPIRPLPVIPRGKAPKWNQKLIDQNATVVEKAIGNKLWYARILECHLDTTTRSIRRHGDNKGNKRKRFRMTAEDVAAETDAFLERSGPPSLDFPYMRDNFYMLEGTWIGSNLAHVLC